MDNICKLCESSVRKDLMPIHIKHYHNILQNNILASLVSRIKTMEKQVEDLTKENTKLLAKNSLNNTLSPELSHLELKKLCQNVRQLDSFYYKTVMAIICGETSNSMLQNKSIEIEDLEKVIVNLEPKIAVSLSKCVNEYQSNTTISINKKDTKQSENIINDKEDNQKSEVIKEEETTEKISEEEITESSMRSPRRTISAKKLISEDLAKKKTCPYCNKKLSHWSLYSHINDIHKAKSSYVRCKFCKKMFRTMNSLYGHKRRCHSGAKA